MALTSTRPVDLTTQPLVDADHVAAMLSVKRKRIYELAARPHDPLPSVRIGGARRFVVAHVEEWVGRQAMA
jgi:predicted DNA-binding transcriptional regulator AlpA